MKIIQSRKEHGCSFEHCCLGKVIPKSSVTVTQLFRKDKGYFVLHFHPECFIQSTIQYVSGKVDALKTKIEERKIKVKSNRPQGRPRKYTDPLKARNLKQLLRYHQKAGNWDKVGELETGIKELET